MVPCLLALMSEKIRIDRLMLARGLAPSRTRAQALIMSGKVVVGDHRVDKAGAMVPSNAQVRVTGHDHPYVSRGGLKLETALKAFPDLVVQGKVALDIGASTGGFTDCLLQRGVSKVHAVDVGYGQLAWKLAQDERVVVWDRQNIRDLTLQTLGERVELAVADCSFISLTKILEPTRPLLSVPAELVLLVKPQFEVGKGRVGKGGIVRDPEARKAALDAVTEHASSLGFVHKGCVPSAITGKEGNQEYLLWLHWPGAAPQQQDEPSPHLGDGQSP